MLSFISDPNGWPFTLLLCLLAVALMMLINRLAPKGESMADWRRRKWREEQEAQHHQLLRKLMLSPKKSAGRRNKELGDDGRRR